MDLAIRIATWRKHKRLAQRELAVAADVSTSAVCLWETGRCSPSQRHIEAVVGALGVTMARFYGRLPRLPKSPPRERAA